ncbi:tRNA (guanosine(46)-N7)-methyltransferase TrmB [Hymenobacter taeanensis]|uniref:tRNA (guanine-N(7)-)-methyltransferase n=1 Tax=Hymenobacter taeanensis TaxID=2735321 RepID=A0A6M6BKT3_9BACT|nr:MULTISPECIES: tRNA (guanosine(46)-N7)-methyltransferase TrmB [Hymenobacter]QJX48617.1 tRNA (guanosine(46)-N7)-methyltransferase TrmB [Hymenobacter taeanensis]UOQ81884.1 tRNA (guanosine(46)-N7)-methyltransferase TrmB [Hymenobacter sp. 5414T-23]
MSRIKLKRFADNAGRHDIVEPGKDNYQQLGGRWHEQFFQNQNPITLEVGCGKGEYTVGLAERYPERNFLGLDIKGDRIWRGSRRAEALGLSNVGFVRTRAHDLLTHFAAGELHEIWITFPDPRPRDRDIKRRLTSPRFLSLYQQLLRPGGLVHLKTDNESLFDYSLETVQQRPGATILAYTKDLYATPELLPHAEDIVTNFESKYRAQGVPIKYLQFQLS